MGAADHVVVCEALPFKRVLQLRTTCLRSLISCHTIAFRMTSGDGLSAAQLSVDETELYDRQIRLWGFEAQNKLRNSRVLVAGMSGLGAEAVKNILLAGIAKLTLWDNNQVTSEDLASNFFARSAQIGESRARASLARCKVLNPMVAVDAISKPANEISDDILREYDLAIVCDQPEPIVRSLNDSCRRLGVGMIAAAVWAWTGYAFFDFNKHSFLTKATQPVLATLEGEAVDVEQDAKLRATTLEDDTFEKKSFAYPSWADAIDVEWMQKKYIRRTVRILPNCYFPVRAMLRLESRFGCRVPIGDVNAFRAACQSELTSANRGEEVVDEEAVDGVFGEQLASVCAIVGGFVAQEAIKGLSEAKDPLRNFFIYSAIAESSGVLLELPPP